MTALAIALILAVAAWLLGLKILAVIFVGIGSVCGIMALWFVVGEGR